MQSSRSFGPRDAIWLIVPSLVWSIGVHGAAICLDPLFLQYAMRRFGSRWVFLLFAGWTICFIIAILFAWNIAPSAYYFYLKEALPYSPPLVIASLALGLLIMVWFAFGGPRGALPQSRALALAVVGVALLALKAVLIFCGQPQIGQHLRSPLASVARMGVENVAPQVASSVAPTPQRTFNAFVRHEPHLEQKLLLTVVESWGETQSALNELGQELQAAGFSDVRTGFTTFKGGTLSGEMRELCSEYPSIGEELGDSRADLDCAPRFITKQGYDVVALHGYTGLFYARDVFWKRFGIGKRLFRDQLSDSPPCGGAFAGTCDADLIHRGVQLLLADPMPRFVYLLTLGSHEPLEPRADLRPGVFFKRVKVLHPTQAINRRAISNLVSDLIASPARSCIRVYVAGDHQPRTVNADAAGFPRDQVPFVTFLYHCGD
jgi:hypothetical protein